MGCASSKLDDLPAVALCRERCTFLDEAIHQRYAFAEAHIAYIHSLKGIGKSLRNYVHQELSNSSSATVIGSSSPPPPHRKGDPEASKSPLHHLNNHHSHSNPDTHLQFYSDSDSDESGSLHHSDHISPWHSPGGDQMRNFGSIESDQGRYSGGVLHMNPMKNKATPSVVFEQRPSPETVHHMGESSSSSSYYPYNNYMSSSSGSNPYPYYGHPPNYGGGIGGYYGGSTPPPYGFMPVSSAVAPQAAASSSKPPPPPPSPPQASAWDFLNPFESVDKYYSQYTPSRDSREVREEEGIPDLEDEDYQHEVVKEVHGHQKFAADVGGKHLKAAAVDDNVGETDVSHYQTRPSVSMDNEGVEYDVHVVDKKVVDDEERSKDRGGGAAFKGRGGSGDVFEVVKEIEAQFQRASESGNEIAQLLEVGKLPYNRKHGMRVCFFCFFWFQFSSYSSLLA